MHSECTEQITRVIFGGPSLPTALITTLPADLKLLPPIERGDLDRLGETFPNVTSIGIVDGKFFESFSISPKEILRSIDKGKRVFGSSTVGALRATELSIYGMEGVGRVYEMFASGEIDSDAEVLLNYDPETFERKSVPMVDIRWALENAGKDGNIPAWTSELTISIAEQIHYADRSYANVLDPLKSQLANREYSHLASALSTSQNVTQKDALLLFEAMGISSAPANDASSSELGRLLQQRSRGRWPVKPGNGAPSLRKEIDEATSPICLPAPTAGLPNLFTDVLNRRRSVRNYSSRSLTLEELSTLLYHAARVVSVAKDSALGDTALRPFPTAGARSELELYLVSQDITGLAAGAYYYDPFHHQLIKLRSRDDHQEEILMAANSMTGGQLNRNPAAALLISAVFDRTVWKYGDLGPSLIYRDAGCLIQTIYLVATALQMAPCALGGELDCNRWLKLDPKKESQVGCVLLGPATDSPVFYASTRDNTAETTAINTIN